MRSHNKHEAQHEADKCVATVGSAEGLWDGPHRRPSVLELYHKHSSHFCSVPLGIVESKKPTTHREAGCQSKLIDDWTPLLFLFHMFFKKLSLFVHITHTHTQTHTLDLLLWTQMFLLYTSKIQSDLYSIWLWNKYSAKAGEVKGIWWNKHANFQQFSICRNSHCTNRLKKRCHRDWLRIYYTA